MLGAHIGKESATCDGGRYAYLTLMTKCKTWRSALELLAAARFFRANAIVLQQCESRYRACKIGCYGTQ